MPLDPAPPGPPPPRSLAERLLASLPGLERFVRRRMGAELAARESASDIVQSTCRELLRSADGFEERGEAGFERWIRAAAEHKLQNRARHWRAQRRAAAERSLDAAPVDQRLDLPAPGADGPTHAAMLREEARRLDAAFASLTPRERALIVRSQIEGASYGELARELARSPEAARKLVARAMARLSAGLAARGAAGGEPGRQRAPLEGPRPPTSPEPPGGGSGNTGRTPIV